jgi:hypothetical protein
MLTFHLNFRLREKIGDNPEIQKLIDEADINHDQKLSAAETKELLLQIDQVR